MGLLFRWSGINQAILFLFTGIQRLGKASLRLAVGSWQEKQGKCIATLLKTFKTGIKAGNSKW